MLQITDLGMLKLQGWGADIIPFLSCKGRRKARHPLTGVGVHPWLIYEIFQNAVDPVSDVQPSLVSTALLLGQLRAMRDRAALMEQHQGCSQGKSQRNLDNSKGLRVEAAAERTQCCTKAHVSEAT